MPISAPIVTRDTVETVATRRPARIAGSASGNSTVTKASAAVPHSPSRFRDVIGDGEQAGQHVADEDRQ